MQSTSQVERHQFHWSCPLNIHGLDIKSLEVFLDHDLKQFMQPVLAPLGREGVLQNDRNQAPLVFGHITDVVEKRVHDLSHVFRQVGLIARSQNIGEQNLKIESLGGDSHQGGHRPIMLRRKEQSVVLKFSDPRPHQLLRDVLMELSSGIGVDLVPPEILPGQSNQWHLMPYLEPCGDMQSNCPKTFMYNIGALTAVVYALRFVDLHLENVLVTGDKPVIVDPECILYNFVNDDPSDRLLSTGLLSHNPSLSALRGGDQLGQHFVQLEVHENADGRIDYSKPIEGFHNRYRLSNGLLADPADYRPEILGGFVGAYIWLMKNRSIVGDILKRWVHDDFRIRYLVRKTRLYAATIHMLNLPSVWPRNMWENYVLSQFKASGHFPEKVSTRILNGEIQDLKNRDIPYFWIYAGEPYVHHATGACQKVSWRRPVAEQAKMDLERLCRSDLDLRTSILTSFLDMDFYAAREME